MTSLAGYDQQGWIRVKQGGHRLYLLNLTHQYVLLCMRVSRNKKKLGTQICGPTFFKKSRKLTLWIMLSPPFHILLLYDSFWPTKYILPVYPFITQDSFLILEKSVFDMSRPSSPNFLRDTVVAGMRSLGTYLMRHHQIFLIARSSSNSIMMQSTKKKTNSLGVPKTRKIMLAFPHAQIHSSQLKTLNFFC